MTNQVFKSCFIEMEETKKFKRLNKRGEISVLISNQIKFLS